MVSETRATLNPTETLVDRCWTDAAPRPLRQLMSSVTLSGRLAGRLDTPAPTSRASVT
jgi:hypothetical protein